MLKLSLLGRALAVLLSISQPWDDTRARATAERGADAGGFSFPCRDYRANRRVDGKFATPVDGPDSPFAGTHRLGDRISLPVGTEVRSVADGVVLYSDFIPSWQDHWSLGNTVVVEHQLDGSGADQHFICSVYAHLAHDRAVKVGDRVRRGQRLGSVGAAESGENGGYPACLHFGVHEGRYYQISPAWRRQVIADARSIGLPFGPGDTIVKGDVAVTRASETSVLVTFEQGGFSGPLSLRVANPAPGHTPTDIVGWCRSHGDRDALSEWLDPVSWIESHLAPPATGLAGSDPETPGTFSYPCANYLDGLRGRGNFGVHVRKSNSPFRGSHHLAEDVWLEAGTKVRSVADGTVMYSDFSPTWTDDRGETHWNLGNVVVIEHELAEAEEGDAHVCSVYVHLSADRRVTVGDQVRRSQLIGFIGKSRSEENGRYPAHLHFGLHRGPYHQVSPAWEQDLKRTAQKHGLPFGPGNASVKGSIELTRTTRTEVLVEFIGQNARATLSLLVGSTSPGYRPADIMGWCQGYGSKVDVEEWLRPSTWIRRHRP